MIHLHGIQPKETLLQVEISFREAVAKPMSPKVPKPSKSAALGSGAGKLITVFFRSTVQKPPVHVADVVVGI